MGEAFIFGPFSFSKQVWPLRGKGASGRTPRTGSGGTTMRGRISKMPRNNTQIGSATTSDWMLDFEPASERHIDPLMGWTSSSDMQSQVRLTFATKEAAIAHAL